ncbi:hypothetical protein [Allosphingosinicella vermicomposti]|uniref:hypothetical protein n=1 Tax=Allosphingosinicella vermicomposti TaxID=614671 RepID=UPI001A9CAB61|nr:hypothetical protein [Allosphingosinicella vermicomposti]
MSRRESERLSVIDVFYPDHDTVIPPRHADSEGVGYSACDLRCGQDGELLLRNFSIQEAQHFFRMENKRVVIKCPECGGYNLLAAAVEKKSDGSIGTLPGGE